VDDNSSDICLLRSIWDFGNDVIDSLASVRTWVEFDGKVPSVESYANWSSGGPYSFSIHRFTPDQKVPSGKFVEFLVYFENKGTEDNEIEMIHPEDSVLDCQLLYGINQKTTAVAFMIPGISAVKEKGLIEEWKGNLKFKLKPEEKTWLLLLFDIPINVSDSKLKLKASTPISVKIPEGKK